MCVHTLVLSLLFSMCVFLLLCVCAPGGQKKVSAPLELEFAGDREPDTGAGKQIQVLCESRECSSLLSYLSGFPYRVSLCCQAGVKLEAILLPQSLSVEVTGACCHAELGPAS